MSKTVAIRPKFGIPAALMLGVALVAGTTLANAAWAQTAAPGTQQQMPSASSFSEEELKTYASAVVKVQEITNSAREKQQATNDPAASDAIEQDAQAKAVTAVKEEGLTVDKYNQIAQATQSNPEIREKVLEYVVEKQNQ